MLEGKGVVMCILTNQQVAVSNSLHAVPTVKVPWNPSVQLVVRGGTVTETTISRYPVRERPLSQHWTFITYSITPWHTWLLSTEQLWFRCTPCFSRHLYTRPLLLQARLVAGTVNVYQQLVVAAVFTGGWPPTQVGPLCRVPLYQGLPSHLRIYFTHDTGDFTGWFW